MDQTIFVYDKIKPSVELIEEVFSYDFKKLDQASSEDISKYCAALAQYLVYMQYQRNKVKIDMIKTKQYIDRAVFQIMDDSTLKKFKTKTAAKEAIITTSEELSKSREKLDTLDTELIMSEGMDKSILELINALKRELTRRSEEMLSVRSGRR